MIRTLRMEYNMRARILYAVCIVYGIDSSDILVLISYFLLFINLFIFA